MQIIVLGMHRSGTSTITRLINMMGAYAGHDEDLIGANRENPRGFWERRDVIEANDALLAHYGCRWYGLAKWSHHGGKPAELPTPALREQFAHVIDEMNRQHNWVIKDPRLCHTLPFWMPLLSDPVAVIVHRDPLEIAQSLKTRNQFLFQHSLALWEYAAVGMLNASRQMPAIHIRYRDVIEDPNKTSRSLFEKLSAQGGQTLSCPSKEMVEGFIEAELYRSRTEDITADKVMTPYQSSLCKMLEDGQTPSSLMRVSFGATELASCADLTGILQEEKIALQEHANRALRTIRDQEKRIEELVEEVQQLHQEMSSLNRGLSDLRDVNEDLQKQVAILGQARDELELIKRTKWWRLRCLMLGEHD